MSYHRVSKTSPHKKKSPTRSEITIGRKTLNPLQKIDKLKQLEAAGKIIYFRGCPIDQSLEDAISFSGDFLTTENIETEIKDVIEEGSNNLSYEHSLRGFIWDAFWELYDSTIRQKWTDGDLSEKEERTIINTLFNKLIADGILIPSMTDKNMYNLKLDEGVCCTPYLEDALFYYNTDLDSKIQAFTGECSDYMYIQDGDFVKPDMDSLVEFRTKEEIDLLKKHFL